MSFTREQFLEQERSADLRAICLELACLLQALLHDQELVGEQAYEHVTRLCGQLMELGIQPNMWVGKTASVYRGPVTFAEYVAGQLVHLLSCPVSPPDTPGADAPHIGDRLAYEKLPLSFSDFASVQTHVNLIRQSLAVQAEEWFSLLKEVPHA